MNNTGKDPRNRREYGLNAHQLVGIIKINDLDTLKAFRRQNGLPDP